MHSALRRLEQRAPAASLGEIVVDLWVVALIHVQCGWSVVEFGLTCAAISRAQLSPTNFRRDHETQPPYHAILTMLRELFRFDALVIVCSRGQNCRYEEKEIRGRRFDCRCAAFVRRWKLVQAKENTRCRPA